MIFLSGRTTGIDNFNQIFDAAAKFVEEKYGEDVVNPCDIARSIMKERDWKNKETFDPKNRHVFVKADFQELLKCDKVYFIYNWVDSPGAKDEEIVAKGCGMELIYGTKEELEKYMKN